MSDQEHAVNPSPEPETESRGLPPSDEGAAGRRGFLKAAIATAPFILTIRSRAAFAAEDGNYPSMDYGAN